MSNLKTQKRIAAGVLGIGQTRVWVNSEAAADIAQAMTREDIRGLIEQGLIKEKPKKVQSRKIAKARVKLARKRKGVSHGKRSGSKGGRKSSKVKWMEKIRAQRSFLKMLKARGAIEGKVYRRYYSTIKGGGYATVKQLKEAMKTEGVLKEVVSKKK